MTAEDYRNGQLILVDKPLEWTSFQVVNKVRWLIRQKFGIKKLKVGHAGTLDPLATGLLVLCTGKFTKKIDTYQAREKEYTGTFSLGATTPSYDLETEIDEIFPIAHIKKENIKAATKKFIGTIDQFPPVFSALKKDGERLYEKARRGEKVQLDARQVYIHKFEITRIEFPEIDFRVVSSKGTYIRTLAEDLGAALGVPAHVGALRRFQSGPFDLEQCVTPEQLTAVREQGSEPDLDRFLLPIEACLPDLPRLVISEAATFYIRQGQPVVVPNGPQSGMVRIADQEGSFLGVGEVRDDGKLAPKRLLAH